MNDNEFKREEKIELNIEHSKNAEVGKNLQLNKTSSRIFIIILLINVILLSGILYTIIEQYNFKQLLENDIENIKEKVNGLSDLNKNLEKLNNNFQILDIINSNTRQIPEILMGLEENNKILETLNINETSRGQKNNISIDLKNEMNNLKQYIKSDINKVLNEKTNRILNEINKIEKNINDKLSETTEKIDRFSINFDNIEKVIEDKNIKILDRINTISLNTKGLEDLINEINSNIKKINSGNKNIYDKVQEIDEKIKEIEGNEVVTKEIEEIKNMVIMIDKKISDLENGISKKQKEYYKKLEYLMNKKDILSLIDKLDNYINGKEFKLIEMINIYNNIVLGYSDFSNDNDVKKSFLKISKMVYSKYLTIITDEISYMERSMYSENIKKDVKYLLYVFERFPENTEFKEEYNTIENYLKKLKELENQKKIEYNNKATYEMNEYLDLFKKKMVSQEEIIKYFKKKILPINENLLEENVKERYYNIIDKTKEILKDRYIW
ncbi:MULTISPECIES: coiled-coil domain-containing protein [unclassified Marinitoga]|uniref:coiled-coil domain-containing protein n=1 Tax=unclassified Marinitoga TaxID=2640159 RepID=UPI00064172E0|nr:MULTISPECIES: hypothetical protein [unclassified Marinitoga]KLO20891.1 hypothetical protein X274_11680 [Marinitoga sp. 1155]NUU99214.1 hypothetical protein [Marinitoga sp. 1154]